MTQQEQDPELLWALGDPYMDWEVGERDAEHSKRVMSLGLAQRALDSEL
jgi:hypothetical protein